MNIGLLFVLLGVATSVTAQRLMDVLGNITQVADFANHINGTGSLRPFFESVSNVTILAPNNGAFRKLNTTESGCATGNGSELHNALIGARVLYHVLDGMYTTSDLERVPKYIFSKLSNNSYENVDRAQVVKAVRPDNNGKSIFIGGLGSSAKVIKKDIRFDGGIIHVLDSFLRLPQNLTYTLEQTRVEGTGLTKSLGASLRGGGIAGMVNATGDITLFVPTNDAFDKVSSIFRKASSDFYRNLLNYHVLDKVLYSRDWDNRSISTFDGKTANLRLRNGIAFVNQARVEVTDVLLNNGVMHVIDRYVQITMKWRTCIAQR